MYYIISNIIIAHLRSTRAQFSIIHVMDGQEPSSFVLASHIMYSSKENRSEIFSSMIELRFEVWTLIWFLAAQLSILGSKALNIDCSACCLPKLRRRYQTAQLSRSPAL